MSKAGHRRPARERQKAERVRWWREGRFGLFVHWGLYAQLKRNEWVLNREKIPWSEYDRLADTWRPKQGFAREWARLARRAGMTYVVLTTKHHEGFSLWDSKLNDFNAVRRGPGRDLIAEYVDACRAEKLRVGFYYSIMDWHHPDGESCVKNDQARKRYVEYTHGLVRELMTRYGKIDILWYDAAFPLMDPVKLESRKLNRMVRRLQPSILINDRAMTREDFGNSEGNIAADKMGRPWEACMTFNGDWGYSAYTPAEDWLPVRNVLEMLRNVTQHGGNLLLNIGPKPDGSVPQEAIDRLIPVGRWLKKNREAVYGLRDKDGPERLLDWMSVGRWTRNGKIGYLWVNRWPDTGEVTVAGMNARLRKASILETGRPIEFQHKGEQIKLRGLPKVCPDRIARITVLKLEFAEVPDQQLGMGRARVDT